MARPLIYLANLVHYVGTSFVAKRMGLRGVAGGFAISDVDVAKRTEQRTASLEVLSMALLKFAELYPMATRTLREDVREFRILRLKVPYVRLSLYKVVLIDIQQFQHDEQRQWIESAIVQLLAIADNCRSKGS